MKRIIQIGIFLISSLLGLNSLAALPQTISFATEAAYPPFESINAKGEMKGFDIDLANALCKQMNVTCTFSNQPWDSLIPSLMLGKFDALIGAMNITEPRKQQVDFTQPYYASTGSFVSMSVSPVEISAAGLKDKVVGVQGGSTFEQYMHGEYPDVKVKPYANLQDAFLDMVVGRVDTVLGDSPTVMNWLKKNDAQTHKFTIIGQPIINPKYFGTGYGIAVKKGNTELLSALNKALDAIKQNGTYEQLVQQYFFVTK